MQKELEVKFFKKIDDNKWEEIKNFVNNEPLIIQRLIANLNGLYIINSMIVVDYVGPKDKKKIFSAYFIKNKKYLTKVFNEFFKKEGIFIENVITLKNLGGDILKQKWIEYLLSLKDAKNIKIIIKEQK